ncbi:MAG: class III poly(R)-hydroxyalkanoic acid synthase subunit PhaC [Candidatus Natronoplasma sp.]
MNENPDLTDLPSQKWMEGQIQYMKDLTKNVKKLNDALELLASQPEVEVGQTPAEVIWEGDLAELLHFKQENVEQKPPVLLVYALINEEYILDLQPGRSVVESLLNEGLDVYMINWYKPDKRHRFETLNDYVNYFMDVCVDKVRKKRNRDSINILGYCMGGTMSSMYAALYPEKVKSLTLMAAGLDFEEDEGLLSHWANSDYFDPEKVVEAFGTCPGDFLDGAYLALAPVNNTVGKLLNLADNAEDEEFVKMFFRMEKWIHDSKDIPGPAFSKFVGDLYQKNKLIKNEFHIGGEHVDINNITMPLLTIIGEYDTLVPPESSLPFKDKVPSEKTKVMKAPVGHIGLSVSSKVHPDLWGKAAEWIKEHDRIPLKSIKGIGEKTAEKLKEASVKDGTDLKRADTEELSEKTGISENRIEKWKKRAE